MTIEELTPAQLEFLANLAADSPELGYIHGLLKNDPSNISLLSGEQKNALQNQLNVILANRPDFPKSVVTQPVIVPKKGISPWVWVAGAAAIYWFFFRKKPSTGGA